MYGPVVGERYGLPVIVLTPRLPRIGHVAQVKAGMVQRYRQCVIDCFGKELFIPLWLIIAQSGMYFYKIYSVEQQGKNLLFAGHGDLQIINQGSFQKPGIVYLLFFCNPFQPCRESDVCLDAFIILFHAE